MIRLLIVENGRRQRMVNDILEIEIKALKEIVNQIEVNNCNDTILFELEEHTKLVKLLSSLKNDSKYGIFAEPEEIIPKKKKIIKPELVEEHDVNNKWFIGRLSRALRGGHIKKFNLYVPEIVIRNNHFEDGDWIKATLDFYDHTKGKNKYSFSLVKKGEAPAHSEVVMIENAVVLRSMVEPNDALVIDHWGEEILLSDKDVNALNLKEGDIVDYSYWVNQIETGTVCWRHSYDQLPEELLIRDVKYEKATAKKKKEKKVLRAVKPIFKDKTVLVISNAGKTHLNALKNEVVRREGKCIFSDAETPNQRFKSTVKKADCVIIFTDTINHEKMWIAKDIVKENKIPVSYTKNLGGDQFILRVKNLLKLTSSNER